MAVIRKTVQKLTYLRPDEGAELDEAVAESEVSCAEFIRQCVLEGLERRREGQATLEAMRDLVVVTADDQVAQGDADTLE